MAQFWQEIEGNNYRAKVPGGWLVKVERTNDLPVYTGTISGIDVYTRIDFTVTFIPDEDHTWNLKELLGIL